MLELVKADLVVFATELCALRSLLDEFLFSDRFVCYCSTVERLLQRNMGRHACVLRVTERGWAAAVFTEVRSQAEVHHRASRGPSRNTSSQLPEQHHSSSFYAF
jgi:hypothetical protein